MATHAELVDAVKRICAASSDPNAWAVGLSGADLDVVFTPFSSTAAIDAVLAKLHAAHPEVFGADAGPTPRAPEGAAADAIRAAETALAGQNSQAAHLDLQVLTAVLNAHTTATDGRAQLTELQRQIEEAVATRTDLGTAAGARDFQRFLVGKLREIRSVLDSAGLDSTSKATLAAAVASLYASVGSEAGGSPGSAAPQGGSAPAAPAGSGVSDPQRAAASHGAVAVEDPGAVDGSEVLPASVLPAWSDGETPAQEAATAPPAGAPPMPSTFPSAIPSAGAFPGGSPFAGLPGLGASQWPDALRAGLNATDPTGADTTAEPDPPEDPAPEDQPDSPVDDPNTVHLPHGETVTAPSPEVATAITAALAGAPIQDAFGWQGIVIAPPGTAVTAPLDPAHLLPGDIGVFTDRHALALGNGTALLDRKIAPIATVVGPGFLGWQHPPAPDPAKATAVIQAPERPALTAPS